MPFLLVCSYKVASTCSSYTDRLGRTALVNYELTLSSTDSSSPSAFLLTDYEPQRMFQAGRASFYRNFLKKSYMKYKSDWATNFEHVSNLVIMSRIKSSPIVLNSKKISAAAPAVIKMSRVSNETSNQIKPCVQ